MEPIIDITNKYLSVFILLDRSGSMQTKWLETISSLNAYVWELQKKGVSGDVTVAAFDNHVVGTAFDIVRQSQPIRDYKAIDITEITPRGSTPLLDSIAKIVKLAQARNNDKTILLVLTDGEENASREVTRAHAADLLELCKARSWEVIFIGAEFAAVKEQAASLGIAGNKFMNTGVGLRGAAMADLGQMSAMYCSASSATIDLNDSIKAKYEGTSK